ncbi:hypothetical protein M431DRAFT_375076 [Trichoderma harzianum CBS 226.95]|uniref:Uncharacterized protein n=1 Tax=Trichoderma harzianum CBS 226.95 TaxID=983964 RepID=A0A2T4AH53_TRIHA|nr:hypothetical protein M431DRAFT_375076 [Trichoderma harzianum CBS 226.95]PTB56409.1 hypothetical protein M431DRAFT_375076 [Trichoderma harzianum CBS 226.95]
MYCRGCRGQFDQASPNPCPCRPRAKVTNHFFRCHRDSQGSLLLGVISQGNRRRAISSPQSQNQLEYCARDGTSNDQCSYVLVQSSAQSRASTEYGTGVTAAVVVLDRLCKGQSCVGARFQTLRHVQSVSVIIADAQQLTDKCCLVLYSTVPWLSPNCMDGSLQVFEIAKYLLTHGKALYLLVCAAW